MRKILVLLLLGKSKKYLSIIRLNGALYKVDIQPFIPANKELEAWESALENSKGA